MEPIMIGNLNSEKCLKMLQSTGLQSEHSQMYPYLSNRPEQLLKSCYGLVSEWYINHPAYEAQTFLYTFTSKVNLF